MNGWGYLERLLKGKSEEEKIKLLCDFYGLSEQEAQAVLDPTILSLSEEQDERLCKP